MTAEILAYREIILMFPVFWIIIFTIYIVFKPQSKVDRLFSYNSKNSEKDILRLLEQLERKNRKDYSKTKRLVIKCYEDEKITEAESTRMEKRIMQVHYNDFESRWSVYTKADPMVLITFLITILYGFVFFNFLIDPKGAMMIKNRLLMNMILVPPALIGLLIYGIFSVYFQVLSGVLYSVGSVQRAQISFNEFIRALKMGGRNTEIKFQGRGLRSGIGRM
jgi:hypothetical protein